ncbi:MAG: AAA family ATPase, partial [Phycisphaerae bacterium]
MTLSQHLYEHIAAAFTGLWVQSYEHEGALAEVARLCNEHEWSLAVWDIDRGLQINGQTAEAATDPVAAIRSINALAPDDGEGSALLVLPNFHRFMSSAEVVQALAHQIHEGRNRRTFIVILSPIVQLPPELEKLFVVIEHELPGTEQLEEIARGVATEDRELPTDTELVRLLEAAAGLTRFEAENAFA